MPFLSHIYDRVEFGPWSNDSASKDFHDNVHCQCVLVYIESVLCYKAFCVDCAHIKHLFIIFSSRSRLIISYVTSYKKIIVYNFPSIFCIWYVTFSKVNLLVTWIQLRCNSYTSIRLDQSINLYPVLPKAYPNKESNVYVLPCYFVAKKW